MKNCLLCNTAFLQPDKIGGKEKLYCTIKCRNKAAHNRMLDTKTRLQRLEGTPKGDLSGDDFADFLLNDSMQTNYQIGLKAVNFLYDIGFLNETHLKAYGVKFKWH